MTSSVDQLTEPQRECLRLVLGHHSSKEIAAKLGVSPSAVDKRIERAVQMLDAPSRFAAARLLAQHEASAFDPIPSQPEQEEASASDRLPWQPIDVPEPAGDLQSEPAEGPWGLGRRLVGLSPAGRGSGRARVRLGTRQRLWLIAAMMLVIAVTSMALLNLATTLSSLIEAHRNVPPR